MKRTAIVATALVLLGALTAPPASATFPGMNGRIAFSTDLRGEVGLSGGSQIYTVAPDGSGIRQLTHVNANHNASGPDWSGDGRRIVYRSDVTGNWEIWAMDRDGSNQTQLTDEPGYDHQDPRWSPDGTHIVFTRCDRALFGYSCPIFVMRADGTGMTKLLDQNWIYAHPDYSPDGTKIAFDSNRGGYLSAIWVMNSDGTNPKRLSPVALEGDFPSWSPDGTHIVFTDFCCQGHSNLWKMRSDGSQLTRVTHVSVESGKQVGLGSYSPNGKRIVFISNENRSNSQSANNDLYTIRPDGTDMRAVVTNHAYVFYSDWGSPPRS